MFIMEILLNETDSFESEKSLGDCGIQVTIKVDVKVDVLVANKTEEGELVAQSTSKTQIDVSLTGPNLVVAAKAGAFIRNYQEIPTESRSITVNTPSDTILNARRYTDGLTLGLTTHILNMFKQHQACYRLVGSMYNSRALDFLADVAKDLVVRINDMKMKITGHEPTLNVEQCMHFCEKDVTLIRRAPIANATQSAPNAEAEGAARRGSPIVTHL